MSAEDKERINSVRKIDPSNPSQFAIMYKYFKYNTATLSFWLKFNVFPVETKQFENKLVATAWNLADNKEIGCRGFSGTSDNRLLLPLQVHQHEVNEVAGSKVLMATDGKMWDLLMRNPRYCSIESNPNKDHPWQLVIKQAHCDCCSGLIDAGKLIL
jgi:hypothetical protein